MNDDITDMIAMLRTSLQASVATTTAALEALEGSIASISESGEASQAMLLDAIQSQLGIAMSEVERFDSTIGNQIKIAQAYAGSLAK